MTHTPYFDLIREREHEAVLFLSDPETGLRGFIGIHNTVLGPALGGCRMKAYASEEAALRDVLQLSEAMTYKASMAGLHYGGGKTVLMIDHPENKTPEMVAALAKRIHLMGGSYYGAGDIGSTTDDLRIIKQHTPYVGGLAQQDGGLGDSATLTALGVYMGIRAAVAERLGRDDLDGLSVAVQGIGKVGFYLTEYLLKAGCRVVASDTNQQAIAYMQARYPQVEIASSETILTQPVDIVSPNAVGGVITEAVVRQMTAKIVAGGANNPLASPSLDAALMERNILFAPDFVVNSGGIILITYEIENRSLEEATRKTEGVYETTRQVFEAARVANAPTWHTAVRLAKQRIAEKKSEILVGTGKQRELAAAL
ncbi:MAG: Glu/Leu/Phe/Val dehydrogenase dimerization domain-containing protein [Candidatus Melainabacteria bacterium]|nr:Glu/Leu/Phe/Val dehydrogenase dimerization domain-containing protein [Candidatus Melainabacteria bacterium]